MPMARVRALLSALFRRERLDQDLDAELQGYYETLVDRYVEQGLPIDEARRKARLEFGGAEQWVYEYLKDVRVYVMFLIAILSYRLFMLRLQGEARAPRWLDGVRGSVV